VLLPGVARGGEARASIESIFVTPPSIGGGEEGGVVKRLRRTSPRKTVPLGLPAIDSGRREDEVCQGNVAP
jgi:hypothetical protein